MGLISGLGIRVRVRVRGRVRVRVRSGVRISSCCVCGGRRAEEWELDV